MLLINNILYLTQAEMEAAGISERTLRSWAAPVRVPHPSEQRQWAYVYEQLAEKYQQQVAAYYGNPYEYQQISLIKQYLVSDYKALEYYRTWKSPTGKFLPCDDKRPEKNYPQVLATAASYMNLFIALTERTLQLDKQLYAALRKDNYNAFRALLKKEGIKLPYSYARLMLARKDYQANGYSVLIPANLENQNARKVKGDTAVLLNAIAGQHNNFNAAQVTTRLNLYAQTAGITLKNGKPLTITRRTALNSINANSMQINAGAKNGKLWNSIYAPYVNRERPASPLYFVCHDGWDVELYYQKKIDGKTNYWQRKMVLIVMDAYNNYPLGYAIYDAGCENAELVREAYLSALYHIKQLTGQYYLPWQVKSDNFSFKSLEPLYNKLAHSPDYVTPIKVGNSKDNPIEPFFNWLNTNYCQPMYNWSGRGHDARKENQANREALTRIRHEFPNEQGVILQIADAIEEVRKAKREAWLQGWMATKEEDKRVVNREQMLADFGIQRPRSIKVTNKGLSPEINGTEYRFMLLEHDFYQYFNQSFTIQYDPYDLSDVLATCHDKRVRYLVPALHKAKMAFKDQAEGDRMHLNRILQFAKEVGQRTLDKHAADHNKALELLEHLDEDTVLKIMPTVNGQQKQLLKRAEQMYKTLEDTTGPVLPTRNSNTGNDSLHDRM